MSILRALRAFFYALNGQYPKGDNIADVIRDGTAHVERNNIVYSDDTDKSFVLASSTADSTKTFSITVDDSGTITATEIVA